MCLAALWWGFRARSCGVLAAPCTHPEQTPDRAAPLQGRTPNRWFAVVVRRRNVEPRSLSMIAIDTLAHTHQRDPWANASASADRTVDSPRGPPPKHRAQRGMQGTVGAQTPLPLVACMRVQFPQPSCVKPAARRRGIRTSELAGRSLSSRS